ncbi:2'-5'-oligoadenylate synthase 3-like [Mya arenaria]|uniref:2'-5'-oligoadenylate synthase 3-like n=1 Tax=Mya arenaria TaxID=6604 RepID=UPI0022E7D3DD|nr:2'-5'-oligoadenylate synthase 3-like [Mya arenaria]
MFISGMDQFQTFVQPAKNLFSTRALNSHNKHKHSNTKILAQRFESVTIYERNQVPSTFAPTSVDLTTNGPSTDLYSVTDLDDFISSEIQPDSSFLAGTSQSVDHLVTLLQHNVPARLRPSRVIKGGSLGKGTAVKGKSDIDMTLIMSKYSNVRDLVRDMPDILSELEESLQHVPEISVDGKTRHAVQISFGESSVDILPAVDVTKEITLDEVYRKMTGSDASVKDFYSASLAPLQTELVRNLPTKVKSLIRLIKYWNKEKVKPMLLSRCPTSYLYEVIIMDRWVKTGRPDSFDMTRAAHDVLTSLKNNRDFKILTTELAKYDRRVADIRAETYIMDPCNPTNDLYNSRFWNWDGVSYVA